MLRRTVTQGGAHRQEPSWKLKCAAYAEYHRLSGAPVEHTEEAETLCRYLFLLTQSSMLVMDLDKGLRIREITAHTLDETRIETDDWYKAHLLGDGNPPRRIVAIREAPYQSSIMRGHRLINSLIALSAGVPTLFLLFRGLDTVFRESFRLTQAEQRESQHPQE